MPSKSNSFTPEKGKIIPILEHLNTFLYSDIKENHTGYAEAIGERNYNNISFGICYHLPTLKI
jgi:hypothetical protein